MIKFDDLQRTKSQVSLFLKKNILGIYKVLHFFTLYINSFPLQPEKKHFLQCFTIEVLLNFRLI